MKFDHLSVGERLGMNTMRMLGLSSLFILSGCSLAPGLYLDDLNLPEQDTAHEYSLGGQVRVVPITARLAEKKKFVRHQMIQERIKASHDLMLSKHKPQKSYVYRVGALDILSISVWGHPELTVMATAKKPGMMPQPVAGVLDNFQSIAVATGHRVDTEGNLYFPYAGTFKVQGLTITQVRKKLTQRLKKYIPDPQVEVGVAAYRSQQVYVLGEVKAPKTLVIRDIPLELVDAITRVGGFNQAADTRNTTLIRDGVEYPIDLTVIYQDGDLTQNYILQAGDVLKIPDNRSNKIYAMGEFKHNVSVPATAHLFSLADLINHPRVGGLNLEAVDAGHILVFRYEEGHYDHENKTFEGIPVAYHLDASSAEAMVLAANFPLRKKDVVYASTSKLERWRRVVKTVLPTLNAVWYPVRTAADRKRALDTN